MAEVTIITRIPHKVEIQAKASYTASEASALLGVHVDTLRRKIKQGKLVGAMYGNKFIILGQNIIDWLNNKVPVK